MKQINKFVKDNIVGSRLRVTVDEGVQFLIECKQDVNQNYIHPSHINPESVCWFITIKKDNKVFVYFSSKGEYNTPEPVCTLVITEPYVYNEMGGKNTQYDSLGFLPDLKKHIYYETGIKINYDCFGKRV